MIISNSVAAQAKEGHSRMQPMETPWEHGCEPLGNPLGTPWEPLGNPLGTPGRVAHNFPQVFRKKYFKTIGIHFETYFLIW
ncbi:hypothetical protein CONCODRAFT_13295 [Conidiobolus coronatus NRRL 28638]|uniref:Uncharacterized protein n=1 Tax=Conidiobolus coronatus (strain ATCC 28846 / CBS 209.66 / NRRL 28638) TaxID=796925 RepID=A0A137NR46_CONC2|nr:hypothetical protein CONCODRAFT_13295 [Conidiobolus coronatus NRRL 28638]|eukprot:KXN65198.1 hypothetical protein CONCODRAFT_13295 [Conidiobolus coronatus NRRL 28638]